MILHEIGHSLGLLHSNAWYSIMHPEFALNAKGRNIQVTLDDIYGIQSIYGNDFLFQCILASLLLHVPCLEQTLAIMSLQSHLFSVCLRRSHLLPVFDNHEFRLPTNVILCRPLLRFPSIFPARPDFLSLCHDICVLGIPIVFSYSLN